MLAAMVDFPSEPNPTDRRPNPLSKPRLVKVRKQALSSSRARTPVSGFNPFRTDSNGTCNPLNPGPNPDSFVSAACSRESSPSTGNFGFGYSSSDNKGENLNSNSSGVGGNFVFGLNLSKSLNRDANADPFASRAGSTENPFNSVGENLNSKSSHLNSNSSGNFVFGSGLRENLIPDNFVFGAGINENPSSIGNFVKSEDANSNETDSGPFVFGNLSEKTSENSSIPNFSLGNGKDGTPILVFSNAEKSKDSSFSLQQKIHTWHPFHAGNLKEQTSTEDVFVFGERKNEKPRSRDNSSVDSSGSFNFGENVKPNKNGENVSKFDSDSFEFGTGIERNSNSRENSQEKNSENENPPFVFGDSGCGNFDSTFVFGANVAHDSNKSEKVDSQEGLDSKLSDQLKKLNLQQNSESYKGFEKTRENNNNNTNNLNFGSDVTANVLPEEMTKLIIGTGIRNSEYQPGVFAFGVSTNNVREDLNEEGSGKTDKSTGSNDDFFVFGSSSGIATSTLHNDMKNLDINREEEKSTEFKECLSLSDDMKKKLNVTGEKVSLASNNKTAKQNFYHLRHQKMAFRDKKGKKKVINMKQMRGAHRPVSDLVFTARSSSTEKDEPESPGSRSPMDCSPYRENLAEEENLVSKTEKLIIEDESSKGTEEEEKGDQEFNAENTYKVENSNVGSDFGMTGFTFAASNSVQGPLPAYKRNYRWRGRARGVSLNINPVPSGSTIRSTTSFLANEGVRSVHSSVHGNRGETSTRKLEERKDETKMDGSSVTALETCEKWRNRGNQAYASGKLAKAEDYYTRGINSIPLNEASGSSNRALTLCFSNRAATRMSLGRMREALTDCMVAARIDPGFLRAHIRAANCLLALGEIEDAIKYYKHCLQSDSVDSKILSEASEGLQNAQKVADYMDKILEILQKRASPEMTRAIELISDALSVSTHSDKLMEMKAKALLTLQKYEEAIKFCEQTLDLAEKNSISVSDSDNQDPRVWRFCLISKSYFYWGKLEQAIEVLNKHEQVKPFVERSPESSVSLIAIIGELLRLKAAGNEAFQAGRYMEAVENYTAALTYNSESCPFSAVCFCNRAAAYQALGQVTDAIADCSLAIALDSNYAKAISRRATLYETIRDYGQAANDLSRLISLLEKQSQGNQPGGVTGKSKNTNKNDLSKACLRLSIMEDEARKRSPLNMYLILGIEPSSSQADVKKAYRKAALRHHPDKAGQFLVRSETIDDATWTEITKEVHKDADHLFKTIGEAYNVVSDVTKRLQYDAEEEIRSMKRSHTVVSRSDEYNVRQQNDRTSSSKHQWRSYKSYHHPCESSRYHW